MRYFIVNMCSGYQLLVQSKTGHLELEQVEEIKEISRERFEELQKETEGIEL